MKCVYYIAYDGLLNNSGVITGSAEVFLREEITRIDQLRDIATALEDERYPGVTLRITFYALLRTES